LIILKKKEESIMIRKNPLLLILVVASLALFLSAERSFAGVPMLVPLSPIGCGDVVLPNLAFIYSNNAGGSQAPCGSNDVYNDMTDTQVCFTTKTSGLIKIQFCGQVDNSSGAQVGVRALVDSSPGDDHPAQPDAVRWVEDPTEQNASCFTWFGEVTNPTGCGFRGKFPCPTNHCVKMQCASFDGTFSQFNRRTLSVYYNKLFPSSVEGCPLL
jgi:hypothetical protein